MQTRDNQFAFRAFSTAEGWVCSIWRQYSCQTVHVTEPAQTRTDAEIAAEAWIESRLKELGYVSPA